MLAIIILIVSLLLTLPHAFLPLELLSHFRLQYLVMAIIAAISLWLCAQPRWALLMIFPIAYHASAIMPWYITDTHDDNKPVAEFVVIQSNLQHGNQQYDKLFKLVEQASPDLLVLLEVDEAWQKELHVLDHRYPFQQVIPRHDNFGIAILSRWPLHNIKVLQLDPMFTPSIQADVAMGEHTITLLATHPVPPINQQLYLARNEQFNNISLLANQRRQYPMMIIGDFNSSMWSDDYQILLQGSGLKNVRQGFGILPTWPVNIPPLMIPLDHTLISSGLRTLSVHTGTEIGSDHLPLVMRLGKMNP